MSKKLLIVSSLGGMLLYSGVQSSGVFEKISEIKNNRLELSISQIQSGIENGTIDINELEPTAAGIDCSNSNFGKTYDNMIYVTKKSEDRYSAILSNPETKKVVYGRGISDDFFSYNPKYVSKEDKDDLEKKLKIANYCYELDKESILVNYRILFAENLRDKI